MLNGLRTEINANVTDIYSMPNWLPYNLIHLFHEYEDLFPPEKLYFTRAKPLGNNMVILICIWFYLLYNDVIFSLFNSGMTAIAVYFFTKEIWSAGAGLFAACFIAIGRYLFCLPVLPYHKKTKWYEYCMKHFYEEKSSRFKVQIFNSYWNTVDWRFFCVKIKKWCGRREVISI